MRFVPMPKVPSTRPLVEQNLAARLTSAHCHCRPKGLRRRVFRRHGDTSTEPTETDWDTVSIHRRSHLPGAVTDCC